MIIPDDISRVDVANFKYSLVTVAADSHTSTTGGSTGHDDRHGHSCWLRAGSSGPCGAPSAAVGEVQTQDLSQSGSQARYISNTQDGWLNRSTESNLVLVHFLIVKCSSHVWRWW